MTAEGTRIADRYVVLSELGRGGMGVVWMAEDQRLGRRVALKVLSPVSVGDATACARLVREARLAASLEHPHIVRTYDVGQTPDGGAFLVMELVRGTSLAQRLDDPTFTLADRVGALVSVARALAHAHRAGLVHRDVKPDNVMRADDGRVVLLDLGVAKPVAAAPGDGAALTATAHGAIVGTPAYLAPEQARGGPIDGRADQFALGVTAYQLATGRLPWSSTNLAGVLAEIVADTPPPPSTYAPSLPASIDAVVMRAMEKGADARFENMDALADALAAAHAEIAPSARAPAPARVDVHAATTPATPAMPAIPPTTRQTVELAAASTRATAVPRRTWPRLLGAAVILALVTWAGLRITAASPLAAPDAIVGCPPLAVASRHEDDDRWIGAAAAALACDQAAVLLGGDEARTLSAAALLDLPRVPSPTSDADVWSDASTREHAVDAARARTSAWIDGDVRPQEDAFAVDLVLRAADGTELGRATASAPTLPRAVGEAMRALAPAFPPTELGRDAAEYLGTTEIETASWIVQWGAALGAGSYVGEVECPHLANEASIAADRRRFVAYWCAARCAEPTPTPAPVAIDDASPALLARTAEAALTLDGALDAASLLQQLAAARARTADPDLTAALVLEEISVRGRLGQSTEELALAAVTADPRVQAAWSGLASSRYGRPDMQSTAQAYATWVPYDPDAWSGLGHTYQEAGEHERARRCYERAVRMSGDSALFASNLARYALSRGDRDTARALAARLLLRSRPSPRLGGQLILVAIDTSETHFLAAFERGRASLAELEVLGAMEWTDGGVLEYAESAARVLGRENELVQWMTERFLDPEPPRVARLGGYLGVVLPPICASATDVALARHCLERVRRALAVDSIAPESQPAIVPAIVDGADHFVAGDFARAARDLHDIRGGRNALLLAREAEARAATPDAAARLAAIVDDPQVPVGWLHVVVTREAEARGDHARSAALARRILDAWAGADADIPVLDELRALADPPDAP